MATGITKREQLSDDAITASVFTRDPIPLPPADEAVHLAYEGKANEADVIRPIETHLTEIRDGVDSRIDAIPGNSFVLADNFEGLHNLLQHGQRATLVYLDPPYGTGMVFQSRKLKHAYADSLAPAQYLETLRRRLILIREVLAEDGSVYVHIGHQMVSHAKVLLDEVFGRCNFRNLIARRKCSSKNFTRKQYANLNDYLLFYSKGRDYKWEPPGIAPEREWIEKEYPKVDDRGRRYKLVPIHAPGVRHGETGQPWRDMQPPPGKHWQYKPSKLEELDRNGDIHWSRNGNPRRKVYWARSKKVGLTDYWQIYRDAHHQSIKITGYPTEKNLEMLKMIVGASSEPGDLVVDPYCGSGTTLHAARDLGRQWIGIDASVVAAESSLMRMRHGVEKMGDYINGTPQPSKNGTLKFDDSSHFIVDTSILESFPDDIEALDSI